MSEALTSLAVIVVFSIIGGFFAAAETALVTLRESQISRLAATGSKRGQRLARLTSNPNRFLAAVQVGVTLTGFISAGYGSSKIVPHISPFFVNLGVPAGLADTISFLLVTGFIAYVSLVIGELVPKRIALQRTEGVAMTLAGPIDTLATISRPFIRLLSVSTNILVRVIGLDPKAGKESMTNEELRRMVATHSGFSDTERALVDDVFSMADRDLREVMIPRTEVAFLNYSTPVSQAATKVMALPHSRYPVVRGSADDVIGFVHVRDILDPNVVRSSVRVERLVREAARFPWSKKVLPALQFMRDNHFHLAIVVDEFGGTAGIVTLEDLVEELIGDIRDEYDEVITLNDTQPSFAGDIDVEGLDNLDDFFDRTGVRLPEGPYETVAGYVMATLGRLPEVGDSVQGPRCELIVEELDGRRAARIRVRKGSKAQAPDDDAAPE